MKRNFKVVSMVNMSINIIGASCVNIFFIINVLMILYIKTKYFAEFTYILYNFKLKQISIN